MNTFKGELIKYNGINAHCMSHDIVHFKQQNLDTNFCIPKNKVEIGDIYEVWGDVCIVNHEVIQTSKGISLENQVMTGYNLFVSGNMKLKFEYISNDENQSVHTIRTIEPFTAYVALPEGFDFKSNIEPLIYIEDIFAKKVDSKCIYISMTFILCIDIWEGGDTNDIQKKI